MDDEIDVYWKAAFIIIVVLAVYEAVILGIGFFGADKVECNWLYCTFTKERRTIEQNSECFENGVKVNCSDLPAWNYLLQQGNQPLNKVEDQTEGGFKSPSGRLIIGGGLDAVK
jgi:hypothetical protein